MKKLIFVLAIFIAAPAFAALDVSLVDNLNNTVSVVYTGADPCVPAEMPRAFALEITIDDPGYFTDVSGYKNDVVHSANGVDETGESNSLYPGFGIYPARIIWDEVQPEEEDRDVNNWGTPIANPNDPRPGNPMPDSNYVVLEFGSLYYTRWPGAVESNAPLASDTLCVLHVNYGGGTNLNVHMTDEDTFRGGLVFENGDLGVIDANVMVNRYDPPPLPDPATNPVPADATAGVNPATTVAISWTAGAGATSHDVYFGTTYPPAGPTNQPGTSYPVTLVQGVTYYASVVERNAVGTSAALDWSFNTECMKSTASGYPPGDPCEGYANWITASKPDCWCYEFQPLGDVDGKVQGTGIFAKQIASVDLGLFAPVFGKKRSQLVGDEICCDLDHLDQGTGIFAKAVASVDLGILATNYGKKPSQMPNPVPYAGDYYYWIVPTP